MSPAEVLGLSAAEALAAIDARELGGGEVFNAYLERAETDRAAGPEGLNCFTCVASERAADSSPRGDSHPLGGLPLAV